MTIVQWRSHLCRVNVGDSKSVIRESLEAELLVNIRCSGVLHVSNNDVSQLNSASFHFSLLAREAWTLSDVTLWILHP